MSTDLQLLPLSRTFTIYQLSPGQEVPKEILDSPFCSLTRTPEEVSVVTDCPREFPELKHETGWKGFRVQGVLDFSLVGILHELTGPLKKAGIGVFVLSTYNTDYLFVKERDFRSACRVYEDSGYLGSE